MIRARLSPKYYWRFGLLSVMVAAVCGIACGEDILHNSSRECAICHIRWIEAFGKAVAEDAAMASVLARQAGSGEMCLSCHDGSVTDSRFKVWSTKHHTTGSKPPARIKIPTDKFPLDSEGRMTCATCHTAHAVPDSSDIETVVFLRQANVDSSLCLACHGEHAVKSERQHPLGRRETPVPQVILDAGGQTSDDGHMVFCQTCHEPHGARNAWMLVLPPSELCVACHTEKAPEAVAPAGAPVHKIGQTYEGFEPPESLLSKKATFGPEGELDCLSCHRLHDASGAWPLLIRNNEDSSLCLECHKKEQPVLGSPHDLRTSSPETVNAGGKTASESGPCGSCHRIHGWARDVVETNRPHSSGCMECHKTGGPGSRNRPYVDSHPVGVPLPEGMTTDLPLDAATGDIGCLTCHDPHKPLHSEDRLSDVTVGSKDEPSSSYSIAIRPEFEAEVHEPRSFLRGKGALLCARCHDKTIDSRTPHDPTEFSPELRRKLAIHPAIGSCRVCHSTHTAHGPRLWSRKPLVADDESVAVLCGACHENKQGIENSVHDPGRAEWARDFGFDSKDVCVDCHPIHDPPGEDGVWSHIAVKGPRACETCHQAGAPGKAVNTPHLAERPQHLDEGWPLEQDGTIRCSTCHDIHQNGVEAMFLRSPRWDSSVCISCHPAMSGLIGTAHDLRTSSPDAENVRGETSVDSGPCGSCHLVHCFEEGNGVLAENSMSRADFGRAMCLGCHREGGSAEERVPKHFEHPEIPLMNRTEPNSPDYMPTFNQNGEPSRTGAISCLTCHEFHPAGQPSEGASGLRRRFLRPTAQQSLCADCHGDETLWRYLYYHKDRRNPKRKEAEDR